ncbi:haloacid dehalogenase-like hydrolase [Candidatus Nomurabacteria bacterium]|uniref:phosphoserine phosphatase n=1 Tax=candidate division WWE3 bacterium TaxID=2053526 RepID=A0A955E0P4_UNCKA|nr:haloacid dehalogenase-like hydrolase [candidate division WWE3 bacterium]MCB9823642.1 haloacid dehalogenase-like hydrolase [Candidatus Nomurabacteria bacterium]MCB9827280.1 haloacid dehalogenase-like hydrolase [Candidatus Nomurabacteria bacterium]MCB9827437.1 haloacid dehalogenase-like hydrolase [Candidatus Nomurabacteria bacterium]HXK52827.1 haloacid dehalogenase-like hydrolase [bacterium]
MAKLIGSKIKHVVLDADGTLFKTENPYLYVAQALNVYEDVLVLINKYLSKDISYEELIEKETSLFSRTYKKMTGRHPHTGDLEKYLPVPKLFDDVKETIEELHRRQVHVYVISSGFYYLVEDLVALGIKLRDIHANKFLYNTHGEFEMIKIDVSGEKIDIMKSIFGNSLGDVAYVGDNAFDEKLCEFVLLSEGTVFFKTTGENLFKMKHSFANKNFHKTKTLSDILSF